VNNLNKNITTIKSHDSNANITDVGAEHLLFRTNCLRSIFEFSGPEQWLDVAGISCGVNETREFVCDEGPFKKDLPPESHGRCRKTSNVWYFLRAVVVRRTCPPATVLKLAFVGCQEQQKLRACPEEWNKQTSK
jgi:hypothetical protein